MLSPDDIKKQLADSRAYLEATLAHIGPDQWKTQVQSEGERWTVRQVLSHLLDAEKGLTGQMKRLQAGKPTIPDDFDLDRWNRGAVRRLSELTPEQLIAGLSESRAALNAFVDGLAADDLQKEGRHTIAGIIPLWRFLQIVAEHEKTHAADIRAALGLEK